MLLTTLSPQDEDTGPPDRLVTLAVVYSLPDAMVRQATLRAYGIPSFTSCAAHASVQWYRIVMLGGIAINVPASLRDLAISLIPDLANPPTRAELTAEIKANGGPHIRKRLVIAHLLIPVVFTLCNLGWLQDTLLRLIDDFGIMGFFGGVAAYILAVAFAFFGIM